MVKRTFEYFIIKDCSGEYNTRDDECFDTFEEAHSHINDLNETNHFKYHGFWTDEQECAISRILISPENKLPTKTDEYWYKNGVLVSAWHSESSLI